MALEPQVKETIVAHLRSDKSRMDHNEILFNIFEGELKRYICKALDEQLSGNALIHAKSRIAPINVLKKITDKLSNIYQRDPSRMIDGNVPESDIELLRWYELNFAINDTMNCADEFYNLAKSCLIQPFVHKGKPRLRAIPPHQFTVLSFDDIDPTVPTHVFVFYGKGKNDRGDECDIWAVYTNENFYFIDQHGDVINRMMVEMDNPDGINVYGRIPFVYVKKTRNLLIPKIDTDTLAMTVLMPVLVTDLNYISMFSAFSVMYGIDVDDQGLTWNPSTFQRFKSKGDGETKPEVGTIKLEGDIDKTLNLIQSELSFWLNSIGLRAGNIGTLTQESFASGVSKLIDEADTTEARQKQITTFRTAESQLWDLVFNYMHPVWRDRRMIENQAKATPAGEVIVNYAEQIPLGSRGQLVEDQQKEVAAGFTTRKRAIKRLNPKMTDEQIDELIEEIDAERTIEIEPDEDDIDGSEG